MTEAVTAVGTSVLVFVPFRQLVMSYRPDQSYRAAAEMFPLRHERGVAMATNSRPTAWCQPGAAPGGVVDSAGRSAPPHGAVDIPRRRDPGRVGTVLYRQRQECC